MYVCMYSRVDYNYNEIILIYHEFSALPLHFFHRRHRRRCIAIRSERISVSIKSLRVPIEMASH